MNLRLIQVDEFGLIPHHPNILVIRKPFINKGFFSVLLPHMEQGSLQSIMLKRFPNGFPEGCILVVLREILMGLYFIHNHGQVHREISVGAIFLKRGSKIKLAYSPSVYNGTDIYEGSTSSCLPMSTICDWASAPEVYQDDKCEYTPKADIWLFGITALELAYGGLKVKDRKALDSMVKNINRRKRLPRRDQDESEKWEKNLCSSVGNWFSGVVGFKKRVFSKAFEDMVAKCLALDPEKRPTAGEILQHNVFTTLTIEDFTSFEDLLNNI
ncbi:MEKK [Handroanthus impetiginosus]|uniref:MEKK n=1 Tax=Handroanthus impetiginosus TaxID=429701 RepID=A0A2G9HG36_9LAMI|nr:MEKK [Handroanthus impetiginosus]